MPRYTVTGADRETAAEISITIEAPNSRDAERFAQARGVLVSGVEQHIDQPSIPRATLHRSLSAPRAAAATAAALGMLGTFLPWVRAPIVGWLAGTAGDGWISFTVFGIALLVALLPDPRAAIGTVRRVIVLVAGLACASLAVQKVLSLHEVRAEAAAEGGLAASFASATQIGNGVWLVLGTGLALVVVAIAVPDRANAARASASRTSRVVGVAMGLAVAIAIAVPAVAVLLASGPSDRPARASGSSPATQINSSVAPAAPTEAELVGVRLGEAAADGPLLVTITDAVVGLARIEDPSARTPRYTRDRVLRIELRVDNESSDRKAEYYTWRGRDGVVLVDDIGNLYLQVDGDGLAKPEGGVFAASLYPGNGVGDALLFQPPVGAARSLRLMLPRFELSRDDPLVFRLDSDDVRRE